MSTSPGVSIRMRTFDTGATRDSDDGKLDYEGFLSPLVLQRYAEYMNQHRKQADGKLRDSDNWQKGIPIKQYLKSLWRHFTDVWMLVRGYRVSVTLEDALCACLFNVMGMLHEIVKARLVKEAAAQNVQVVRCGECRYQLCCIRHADQVACRRFRPEGSA